MVIFGWREAKINIQPVHNHSCSYCNTPEHLFIQVNRLYVHIFWIPVFPLFKKTYSICGHCKLEMSKSQMPPDLQKKAKDFKKTSKTPWWMFLGLIIITSLMLFVFSSALLIHK
ncbi:zinc ribbon family protein [Tenacibaculum lutimaris]|uniref:Zinc ribbon family protein n=1 Tax=Tenacibaculum lutimaris TaxID=285258 RepID=A0A420DYY7_9FLAO|nr:zinc-ribbon domain-containing protein [Tenacibaculum lutimaris]RKF03029.1 zinc ribbon family protein [Tenacibaculum lutimaris]